MPTPSITPCDAPSRDEIPTRISGLSEMVRHIALLRRHGDVAGARSLLRAAAEVWLRRAQRQEGERAARLRALGRRFSEAAASDAAWALLEAEHAARFRARA